MSYYYFFSTADRRLRHGDNRLIEVGVTHKIEGEPVLCEHGLHASKRAIDALEYAPGPWCWKVELGGTIIHGTDKAVATERTYLAGFDATEVLRRFARLCALDVIHLWDAPDVVVRFLKTGDESLRAEAENAAWAAAWDAAGDAAENAAWAATWDAAWAATRDAARAKQNRRLAQMLAAGFGGGA